MIITTEEQIKNDPVLSKVLEEQKEHEKTLEFNNFKVSFLRTVFEKVTEKSAHWKDAWTASVPVGLISAVTSSVMYFHADTPVVAKLHGATVTMYGAGYQAW